MVKSNQIEVLYEDSIAGKLERLKEGYGFKYNQEYLDNPYSFPISCNIPLSNKDFFSEHLHPFFEGLAPQGWYKNGLELIGKINKNDIFTLLAVNGEDLPGSVKLRALDIEPNEKIAYEDFYTHKEPRALDTGNCLKCFREAKTDYHSKCIKDFFDVKKEPIVPITTEDFKQKMYRYISRASISGMQTKVGVIITDGVIHPKSVHSRFILKPPIPEHEFSAVYEQLSMLITNNILGKGRVAESSLLKMADSKLAYMTKRFDRIFNEDEKEPSKNVHFEDLTQIIGIEQFAGSYEQAGRAILEHSNKVVLSEFLSALLSQFYIGNNDFHLKNIALLGLTKSGKYEGLAPLYDCINVESLLRDTGRMDEMAISFFEDEDFYTPEFLNDGHASYSTFKLLYEKFEISDTILKRELKILNKKHSGNIEIAAKSILPDEDKDSFISVLNDRLSKINKHS